MTVITIIDTGIRTVEAMPIRRRTFLVDPTGSPRPWAGS